jgi:hypothetical protein
MSVGGKKDDYDFQRTDDDLTWWAEQRFNIREVRMISSTLQNYKTVWQGEPERPKEEMEFVDWYQGRLFAMITDYNYTHHEVEEGVDDSTPSGDDT